MDAVVAAQNFVAGRERAKTPDFTQTIAARSRVVAKIYRPFFLA